MNNISSNENKNKKKKNQILKVKMKILKYKVPVGGKDLNFYVGPQAPITNNSTSKEEKTFGKAP